MHADNICLCMSEVLVVVRHVKLLHLDVCILSKLNCGVDLRQHVLYAVLVRDIQRQEGDLRERERNS